ncbi:MAG: hypothetical protein LDL56_04345 [Armatimonadetes bacterium]|nr:hypothetical protein [Armatimonadota bacterium]
MTTAQQARTAGFRAQLAVRGFALRLLPDRGSFNTLVEHFSAPQPGLAADTGPHVLDPHLRQAARLAVLKEDAAGVPFVPGDVLRDELTQIDYRVVRVEDRGVDVALRLTCEIENAA